MIRPITYLTAVTEAPRAPDTPILSYSIKSLSSNESLPIASYYLNDLAKRGKSSRRLSGDSHYSNATVKEASQERKESIAIIKSCSEQAIQSIEEANKEKIRRLSTRNLHSNQSSDLNIRIQKIHESEYSKIAVIEQTTKTFIKAFKRNGSFASPQAKEYKQVIMLYKEKKTEPIRPLSSGQTRIKLRRL
ncbi:MAG: hypothetical protein SP4CHLAM5_04540 [Chlamydiia bacterium]|nr:hypothetical protein [Chlamydiia bacterium]MCH9618327.1 hypothetical protein [Chlamydiia bacterium]MCH9624499.1 hypothetical protein [Chlamydiia bacterium]